MLDRSRLNELYPKPGTRIDSVSDKSSVVELREVIVSGLLIATQLSLVVSMFMVMINYFMQIINPSSIISLLPMIVILLMAWMGFVFMILGNISKRLYKINVANVIFLLFYGLSALPVAQLIFITYRHFNGGAVDILPFIGMLFVENIIFVLVILLLASSEKISDKSKILWLILLIIFFILVTCINSIYQ